MSRDVVRGTVKGTVKVAQFVPLDDRDDPPGVAVWFLGALLVVLLSAALHDALVSTTPQHQQHQPVRPPRRGDVLPLTSATRPVGSRSP